MVPTEGSAPAAMSRSVNAIDVYWVEPASLWWTRPDRSVTPSRARVQIACSRASRTSAVGVYGAR
jgi:hypothetical protein